MAGHTFRFSPLVNHVRSLVEGGELGEIYSIDSQRLNLGRVRRDVDAIWNFAPHDISILNYWLDGHPRAVHCHAYDYLQPGIPDLAFLVLEYERTVAHVHISWLHPSKVRRMTVIGSQKMVVYDDVEGQIVVHDAGIDREHVDRSFPDFETFGEFRLIQRVGDMHIPRVQMAEPLALQCRHFVDCVKNGTEPITDFEDAARVVEVLEAASASHTNGGARVEIADLP
jgi:predicted dehydrogenase